MRDANAGIDVRRMGMRPLNLKVSATGDRLLKIPEYPVAKSQTSWRSASERFYLRTLSRSLGRAKSTSNTKGVAEEVATEVGCAIAEIKVGEIRFSHQKTCWMRPIILHGTESPWRGRGSRSRGQGAYHNLGRVPVCRR